MIDRNVELKSGNAYTYSTRNFPNHIGIYNEETKTFWNNYCENLVECCYDIREMGVINE